MQVIIERAVEGATIAAENGATEASAHGDLRLGKHEAGGSLYAASKPATAEAVVVEAAGGGA
jgi:hypothetical protein